MTNTDVTALNDTVQETHEWITELTREGPFEVPQQAYSWLRAVLHSLRDRLNVDEAAHLASQLPMLVRGFYYEGYRPALAPNEEATRAEFFDSIRQSLDGGVGTSHEEIEAATRAIFGLLEDRLTEGQVRHVLSQLPDEVRSLWSVELTA